MLENQVSKVAPEFETFKYARHPNTQVKRTAAYGTPYLVIEEKTLGACPLSAIEYKTPEQEYKKALLADHADVT